MGQHVYNVTKFTVLGFLNVKKRAIEIAAYLDGKLPLKAKDRQTFVEWRVDTVEWLLSDYVFWGYIEKVKKHNYPAYRNTPYGTEMLARMDRRLLDRVEKPLYLVRENNALGIGGYGDRNSKRFRKQRLEIFDTPDEPRIISRPRIEGPRIEEGRKLD